MTTNRARDQHANDGSKQRDGAVSRDDHHRMCTYAGNRGVPDLASVDQSSAKRAAIEKVAILAIRSSCSGLAEE